MENLVVQNNIENRIFTIRGCQVMIDRDLSELYNVETKRINEQVKRNNERFPFEFCFQLSVNEKIELVANCDRFEALKHSTSLPYVFTEQGVAMLSAVLKSETAVKISIQIMNAFVGMRKVLNQNAGLFQRLDKIETKLLESDVKFEAVFKALEKRDLQPQKGVFFDGEVFDAWVFVSDLVRSAQHSLVLIDNYVDDTVLKLFNKRKSGVSVSIYTKTINKQLLTDLEKHNQQYDAITIKELKTAHDRFLIIDNTQLYHIGASLKDLGNKWFAFSKMDDETNKILNLINSQL
jgi:hypothetical protein